MRWARPTSRRSPACSASSPTSPPTRPTTIDATAYGVLANILLVPVESELKRSAATFANLVAWTEAMERSLAA